MTALSDALEAAQAKALAALEKAFVRDVLNESDFLAKLDEIGATDVADQGQLLACLHVLKEQGQTEPAYTERRKTEKPTAAQAGYIARLADERGFPAPDLAGVNREQASEIITSLQNGTYDPAKYDVPF